MYHFNPQEDIQTKYVVFAGPGGSGKTSAACAAAVSLADRGCRTLFIGTDAVSHLSELFDMSFTTPVATVPQIPKLDIMSIDPLQDFEHVFVQLEQFLLNPATRFQYSYVIADIWDTEWMLQELRSPLFSDHHELMHVLTDPNQTSAFLVSRPLTTEFCKTAQSVQRLRSIGMNRILLLVNSLVLRDDGAAARIIYQLQQKAIAAMPAILHELPARQIPMRSYSISNTSSVRSSLREDYFTPSSEMMDVSQPQQLQDIIHSIHTNNRKLVIILGSSGSGKSTLAKSLSQRLMHQNKHVRLYSSTNMPLKHLLSDGLVAFRELLEQPNTVVILDYSAKEYALGSMRRNGKTISTAQHLLPQLQLMLSDLTEIIMVTTPEKEPATQAMRIQNFLQHLGVCIDYWIVNQSLYPMHPESSLLKAKASFEVPWINEICRRSNGRFVLVPWEDDAG